MKKSIFTKALLGLAAIVGVTFAAQPTVEVTPESMLVEPGEQFYFTITYTNTCVLLVRIIENGQQGDFNLLLNEETINKPTENMCFVRGVITEYDTERLYQVLACGENVNQERDIDYIICRTIPRQ